MSVWMLHSLLAAGVVLAAPHVDRVVDEVAIRRLTAPEQELVREYARCWPSVREFYSSMQFEGSIYFESRTVDQPEFTIGSEFHGTAKILNNEMFRLTGRMPDGSSGMVISNARDVYAFVWNEEKQKHFLASRFKTASVFMDDYISKYAFHIEPFSNGEFHRIVFGIPQAPNQTVTLEKIEAVDENGEEIVKATVLCRGTNQRVTWCRILMFSFLRQLSWAKRDVVSAFPDPATKTYSVAATLCQYEGEVGGIPLLKECIRESGSAPFSDATVDRCRVYSPAEVTYYSRSRALAARFIPTPPDRSEFDPAPYLKEMGGLGQPMTSHARPTILLANAVFLWIVAIVLLSRRKRSPDRVTEPSPPGTVLVSQSHELF